MNRIKLAIKRFALVVLCFVIAANIMDGHVFARGLECAADAWYENSVLTVQIEMNMYKDGKIICVLYDHATMVGAVCENADREKKVRFSKGLTGDRVKVFLWDDETKMIPLCEAKTVFVNKEPGMRTVSEFGQPGNFKGYAGQFAVENSIVYLCRQGRIYKIDISDADAPIVTAENYYSKNVSAITATAVEINDDYIYVGNRLVSAGYPTQEEEENLKAGAFVVLKKSDLSVVSITPLGEKVSGMVMHDKLLVVNLQMLGWAIYDVTDAEKPVMIERVVYERGKSYETQGGEIFEHAGRVYYAVAGFGDGIRMYDITEFYEYVENREKFEDVPEIGDDNLLWFYHFHSHGIGGNHTYDLTVKYPYVYATIAAQKSQRENPDRVQGIITFDITDIEKAPQRHILSMIDVEDKNAMVTESDTQPSIIYRVGDWLIVNNDAKGIAYFDIEKNPAKPEYKGTFGVSEGCCIYRMAADDKNRLILTDGAGCNHPKMYIVEGF